MRAFVSSQVFLMSSPLRPMMLPTLRTGTMRRNTQRPGHPGHRFSAAASVVWSSSEVVEGGSAWSGLSDRRGLVVPFWIGSRVAIEEEIWKLGFMGLVG